VSKNEHAVALGKRAAGCKKRFTPATIEALKQRLVHARKVRADKMLNAPRQFPARSDGKLDADVGG
jgi:hypothetical protein